MRTLQKSVGVAGLALLFGAVAFGQAIPYTGRNIRQAHSHLVEHGLGDKHFDLIAGHLTNTLKELSVSGDLIAEVLTIVEGTRSDVLSR